MEFRYISNVQLKFWIKSLVPINNICTIRIGFFNRLNFVINEFISRSDGLLNVAIFQILDFNVIMNTSNLSDHADDENGKQKWTPAPGKNRFDL